MMFSPIGDTVNVAVTASAQTLTFTAPPSGQITGNVRLVNDGAVTVFVRFDGVTATVANGLPLLPGTVEMFGGAAAVSVIAAATGSTLYATCGQGE